jgi:hypothetical protein
MDKFGDGKLEIELPWAIASNSERDAGYDIALPRGNGRQVQQSPEA